MQDILILTGSCGVGKSTLARRWAERRLGAAIECDTLRNWILDPTLHTANGYQEPLLARQVVCLAQAYMALGLDVAVDNVWTPAGLAYLQNHLGDQARLCMVWLTCAAAENHERDLRRPPSDVMGGRVDELQAELDALDWPADLVRLDTTGQTVDETLAEIEALFEQKPGARVNGLALRPSMPDDVDFLVAVTQETISGYALETWPQMTPEELDRAMREDVIIGQDQIVLLHGRPVGVLSVEVKPDEHFVDKLLILPDYQRRGIGTDLVRRVLKEAFDAGQPVKLHVLKVNPARRLYKRLGFVEIEDTASSYVMQATPP